MPSYKLLYFNLMGRAELARLLFAEAGVDYEDKRFSREEWPSIKPDTPFGQVPVLYIDDKPLPQSGAIVRYLAREFNLAGESCQQQAWADALYETVVENVSKLPFMEEDPVKKKEITDEVLQTKICPVFEKIECHVKSKKIDFLTGNSLTYTDICFMHIAQALDSIDPAVMEKYPTLKGIAKRIEDRPKIKKWLETRPKTPL